MCYYLGVSKSSYYKWLQQKDQTKEMTATDYLKARIRVVFYDNHQVYGSLKIQEMLKREGLEYCRSYVARLMSEMNLRSVVKKKFVVTTDSKHNLPKAPNKLNREFHTEQLGKKWVSDITYIPIGANWCYLTTIIDLADRRVVGWSLSRTMTAEDTVVTAWLDAKSKRRTADGFIFHSDQGVQFAASCFTRFFLFTSTLAQSMSRKGNCWDNAVAESFFKSIKCEWLNRFKFSNFDEAYSQVYKYINWYNTKRIHASLGYLTPLEMEEQIRKQGMNLAA